MSEAARSNTLPLVGRAVALAAFVAGPVGGVFFGFTIAHSRRQFSEVVPFGGWQVNLADGVLTFACLGVFVLAMVGLRRYKVPAGTSVVYQVVVTLLAITLGTGIAAAGDAGGRHLMHWASSHTSGAHRLAILMRLANGDATHRPVPPRAPGQLDAPAALGRPLLTPADLGATWQYDWNPQITIGYPPKPVDQPQPKYVIRAHMATMHWNGQYWHSDQIIGEWVTRYATASEARSILLAQVHDSSACPHCGATFTARRIAVQQVWVSRYPPGVSGGTVVWISHSLVVHMLLTSFDPHATGARSIDDILRLAVERFAANT